MRVPVWFTLEPADLDFTRTSPHRLENRVECDARPEHIFAIAAGERFHDWLEELRAWEWTSPAPHGTGTTREVHLNLLSARERMLAWHVGERLTYCIEEATLPFARRLVEDIQITELPSGRCVIDYVVHYELLLLAKPFNPVLKGLFGRMFAKAARRLAEVSEEHARRQHQSQA